MEGVGRGWEEVNSYDGVGARLCRLAVCFRNRYDFLMTFVLGVTRCCDECERWLNETDVQQLPVACPA